MQLLLQQAVALQHGHHNLLPHPVAPIIMFGLLPANKTIFVSLSMCCDSTVHIPPHNDRSSPNI